MIKKICLVSVLLLFISQNLFAAAVVKVINYAPTDLAIVNKINLNLWQAVATKLNLPYEMVTMTDRQAALEMLKTDQAELVIGPLEFVPDAQGVDYVNSYIPNVVGVLEQVSILSSIFTKIKEFAFAFGGLALSSLTLYIIIFSLLIWLAERKKADSFFSKNPIKGLGTALWFSAVTFTTVAYGDITPKTVLGRIITTVWIFMSVVLLSTFVATISSSLTVHAQKNTYTTSKENFSDRSIAYLINDQQAENAVLANSGIPVSVPTLSALFAAVKDHKASAAFANQLVLKNYLITHPDQKLQVTPLIVWRGNYAFIMRYAHPLESELNKALYFFEASGETNKIIAKTLAAKVV